MQFSQVSEDKGGAESGLEAGKLVAERNTPAMNNHENAIILKQHFKQLKE